MIETLTGQRSQVSAIYWLAPSVEGKGTFHRSGVSEYFWQREIAL